MFTALASIFWALHNLAHPSDDRQNGLINRVEEAGLKVRFLTLFGIQVLLIANAGQTITSVVACLIIMMNGTHLITVFVVIATEMANQFGAMAAGKTADGMDADGDMFKMMFQKICVKWLSKLMAGIIRVVGRIFLVIQKRKARLAERAPRFIWVGRGLNTRVAHHIERKQAGYLDKFANGVYRLGDEQHRGYAAAATGGMLNLMLTNASFEQLPANLLDLIFSLPVALNRIDDRKGSGRRVPIKEVIKEVQDLMKEVASRKDDNIAARMASGSSLASEAEESF